MDVGGVCSRWHDQLLCSELQILGKGFEAKALIHYQWFAAIGGAVLWITIGISRTSLSRSP
jgi:hypothetical protein